MADEPNMTTDRLTTRLPRAADSSVHQAFFADADASHFFGGPLSTDAAWLQLARDVGHWRLRGFGPWMLERRADGAVVGGCGFFLHEGWRRPERAWWILPEARRRGFAKEASRAALVFAYDHLRWDMAQTYVKDANHAARSLAMALGGVEIARETFPDGVARNVYALPRPAPGDD